MEQSQILKIVTDKLPVNNKIILLSYGGSRLYGTMTPTSDEDYRGLFLENFDCLLRRQTFDELNLSSPDLQMHGVNKFFNLLYKGSPSTIELLFIPQEMIILATSEYDYIRGCRECLLSKQIVSSILGYAKSEWDQYINSPRSRKLGAKRKAQIAAAGYSYKNASHCLRILQMGIDILLDKEIKFPSIERDFLLEVKLGNVSFDVVHKEFNRRMDLLKSSEVISSLPSQCDIDKINMIFYEVITPLIIKGLWDYGTIR